MPTTNEHDPRSLEQLKPLFYDQRWLITRLAQENGSYHGYLTDLAQAWSAADARTRQQIHDGQPPTALADCIRYALIHTTIVGNLGHRSPLPSVYGGNADVPLSWESLRDFLPDEEAADPVPSSLETIRQIRNPEQRAEALIRLAEEAAEEERTVIVQSAVEAILAIQEGYWAFPGHLWERLQPYLLEEHFTQPVLLILASPNAVARAWFIYSSARSMRKNLLEKAVDSAFAIQDPAVRALTLWRLIDHTREKQRLRILGELCQTVPRMDDPNWKGEMLVWLIDRLSGRRRASVIRQAMAVIPLIYGHSRGSYADRLIPHLTRGQRAQFLKKVLNTPGVESQIEACLTLWRYLPKEARQQALNLALQVRDRPARAKYLAQIAQKLRTKAAYPELIQHVAKTILEIRNEDHRRTALSDVRSYVQDEAIEQAAKLPAKRLTPGLERLPGYRFAFAQRDPQYIAYALGNLSASMSDEPRIQAQSLMVDLALEIDLHDYVAEAIEGIAPYLDEPHLGEALEGALRIGNGWSRVWALSGLAPYLTGERLTICLSDALAATGLLDEKDDHSDSWYIVDMAARLLPSLKGRVRERVLSKGLAAAQTSADDFYDSRIRFLAYLDSAAQSELAEAVLRDVARLPDEAAQAHTLSGLAPYLSAHLVALALQSANVIQDDDDRESALSALIPHLPDTQLVVQRRRGEG